MLDFSRMLPAQVFIQPLLVGCLLFIAQVGYFTWLAASGCDDPLNPLDPDCVWLVYEKVRKVLVMAAVYAAIGGVLVQILTRFSFSDLTLGEFHKAVREHRVRMISFYAVYYALLTGAVVVLVLEGTSLSPYIPNLLSIMLASMLALILVDVWSDWIRRQVLARETDTQDRT